MLINENFVHIPPLGLILGIFAHPSQSYCGRPHLWDWDYPFLQDSLVSPIIHTGTQNVRGRLQSGYRVPALPGSADAKATMDAVKPAQAAQETAASIFMSLPCPAHSTPLLVLLGRPLPNESQVTWKGVVGRLRQMWGVKFLGPQIKHRAA